MSNRTIAKFCRFVILLSVSCAFALACSHASPNGRYAVNSSDLSPDYEKPVTVGRIESNDIVESSGLAASLCQPDVFWTHNDSGDDEFIFAINSKGKHLGTWRVSNARNDDWEDIAEYKDSSGTCYLYIGDIGNNKRERGEQSVYRVREPAISNAGASSSKKNPLVTEPADAAGFKYPDAPHDAETLMVQPQTGDVYVLTKRVDGPSLVFKIKPQFGSSSPAEKVGEVALPAVPNGLLTGGSISPDAKRVIICDYSAGYELGLGNASSFDDIWKAKPVPVDLGDRRQGEAVTFSPDGRSIYTTSEKRNSPIIEVKRK
jgi:hypothetical protein